MVHSLQTLLTVPWLTSGVDNLIDALGPAATESTSVLTVGPDGTVGVGEEFRHVEDTWFQGVATIARSGTGVIIDEVFLGGAASQSRLSSALTNLNVLWWAFTATRKLRQRESCLVRIESVGWRERRRVPYAKGFATTSKLTLPICLHSSAPMSSGEA